MFLTGEYELTIDAKNRVSIPHGIRIKLNPDTDGRCFYLLPGRRLGTIAIYPERYYERIRDLPRPESSLAESYHEWMQFESSQTYLVEPDQQGRILIPERLRTRTGLEKEVTMIGVRDHAELWSRRDFEEFIAARWPQYPSHRLAAEKAYHGRTSPTEAASSAGSE